MELNDLKAHAYDVLAQMENLQRELRETNLRIEAELRKSSSPATSDSGASTTPAESS